MQIRTALDWCCSCLQLDQSVCGGLRSRTIASAIPAAKTLGARCVGTDPRDRLALTQRERARAYCRCACAAILGPGSPCRSATEQDGERKSSGRAGVLCEQRQPLERGNSVRAVVELEYQAEAGILEWTRREVDIGLGCSTAGPEMTLREASTRARASTDAFRVRLARTRALTVLSARARIEEARGRLKGASVLFQQNPSLEAEASPRLSSPNNFTDVDMALTQEFELGGRRKARIAGAEAGVAREAGDSGEATRRLLRAVATSFSRALAAEERVRFLTTTETLAQEFRQIAERRYRAGDWRFSK
jgi:Outer membrane efflux protein